jgi:hypothetical protein
MLGNDLPVMDISVHPKEDLPKKQMGHTLKVIEISLADLSVPLSDVLLTLDIIPNRFSFTCIAALKLHLTEHQR